MRRGKELEDLICSIHLAILYGIWQLPAEEKLELKLWMEKKKALTKASPHGEAFYFSTSFSLVEKLAQTFI